MSAWIERLKQPGAKRLFDLLTWAAVAVMGVHLYRTVNPAIDLQDAPAAAPEFELADLDGRPFRLSDHRGSVVVLNFWATWCPPCRAEIPGFIALQEEMRGRGVVFVGVALDEEGAEVVRPYAERRGINYRLVADRGRVAGLYGGIATVPTTFLIDRQGRIRYRHEGLLAKPALAAALDRLSREDGAALSRGS